METTIESKKLYSHCNLETFLGGMETTFHRYRPEHSDVLETFLSGMETSRAPDGGAPKLCALKPSLVEWKLLAELEEKIAELPLKPSLVEWKRVQNTNSSRQPSGP